MSLNTPSPAQVILEDEEAYDPWGKGIALYALKVKLVHELNRDLSYFPENSDALLVFEGTHWDKETSKQTAKELKDAGILKPRPLHPSVLIPFGDTQQGIELAAEAGERVEFRQKAAVYNAKQTLLQKTFTAEAKEYDETWQVLQKSVMFLE